jgi:peptide/nickel transport system substrate-binding protein
VTDGGKTYTLTLRPNLKFSNGSPVVVSDVAFAIERSIKLNWGGASFYTGNIVGATAFADGKAKTISGITSDDTTGVITFHLLAPYGAFPNLLSFVNAAPLPPTTAMKNLSNDPPPGVGPMEIKNVVPDQSYEVAINPVYASEEIPGVPAAKVNVDVKVVSNPETEAEEVLNNSADYFDFGDTLPPSLVAQIEGQDTSRFSKQKEISTFYFFMNTANKPFSSQLAREAVVTALDRTALERLASGFITPDCYFIPDGMTGHPTAPCPYGSATAQGNIPKAKALVQQSGMAGTPVTVYGQARDPRDKYVAYYTQLLNQIGFKATEKIISDAQYFPTIGNLKTEPQTGFADWIQDFPDPIDYYLLLSKSAIQATNNENYGQVDDPMIESAVKSLGPVPSTELTSVASKWTAIDEYTATKAYTAVFGDETVPFFFSTRINFGAAVFNAEDGTLFNSLQLNS